MSAEQVQARPGAYADSVTLMRVSAEAQAVSGVRAAMVVAMARNGTLVTPPPDVFPAALAQEQSALDPVQFMIAEAWR